MSAEKVPLQVPQLGEAEFARLQQLMQAASGIHLNAHKRTLVAGRLLRRLRALDLSGYSDYLRLLDQPEQQTERRLVIDLLTTNETFFFREPQHFRFLATWLQEQRRPLRVWSAACSSGEEAYSLAMLLAEHAGHDDWRILATDLSQRMLEKARAAVYPLADSHAFPPGWLQRHCLKGVGEQQGLFRIGTALRQRISVRELNLMRELPSDVPVCDLIFLRNVLIYFNAADKRAIVARLIERLRPGGLLFIGHAESVQGFDLPLKSLAPSILRRQ